MSTATATAPTIEAPTAALPDVTTEDCDRCGYSDNGRGARIAQAFVRITLPPSSRLPEGGTLTLCGHHANEHMAALVATSAQVDDQRSKINEKPSVSANKD